jgi:hypothetical protein
VVKHPDPVVTELLEVCDHFAILKKKLPERRFQPAIVAISNQSPPLASEFHRAGSAIRRAS